MLGLAVSAVWSDVGLKMGGVLGVGRGGAGRGGARRGEEGENEHRERERWLRLLLGGRWPVPWEVREKKKHIWKDQAPHGLDCEF